MMEMFDFKSIEENKQGKKSEKQVKEIKEAVDPKTWLWGGVAILAIGGCFYFVLASLAGGGGGVIYMFVWILGLAGLFVVLRGLTTWNLRRKLLTEPVQNAEGTVKYTMQNAIAQLMEPDHYSAETYEGKKLHPIGLAGVNPKLPPGDYRFYFLKTRNWLLESEPLFSEDEMRSALNELLANVMGYDQAYLENCRMEAKLGQLKTVEGLPKLESHQHSITVDEQEIDNSEFYCTLGEVRFQISGAINNAIFEQLPHRAYFREGDGGGLAAIELAD
jgi:hypothetical protein